MPDRRSKMLTGLTPDQLRGAEIGALDRPLVKKSEGSIIYLHGNEEIPPALEAELDGVEEGAEIEVTLGPGIAYGDYNPEAFAQFDALARKIMNRTSAVQTQPTLRIAASMCARWRRATGSAASPSSPSPPWC